MRFMVLLPLLHASLDGGEFFFGKLPYDFCRALYAEEAGVEAEVVGLGGAPALLRVEIIVLGAALVALVDAACGLGLGDVVHPAEARYAVAAVGHDEDVDRAGHIAQDVVGAAADDDAGRLLRGAAYGK